MNFKNLVNVPIVKPVDKPITANIGVLNFQSASNKVDNIVDFIEENKLDIVFASETWVSNDNDFICKQFTPNNFSTHHISRVGKSGGGVCIITKNFLRAQALESGKYVSFEHAIVRIKANQEFLIAVAVYRPPGPVTNEFLAEFSNLLETHTLNLNRILVCGDFNIHMDNPSDKGVSKFTDMIRAFQLEQHVQSKTHIHGHTIDLVITRTNDPCLSKSPLPTELFSDHFAIEFQYRINCKPDDIEFISYRKLSKMDMEKYRSDISSLSHVDPNMGLDSLVETYNNTLRTALDEGAPLVKKRVKKHKPKPWIDQEVHDERNKRRKFERRMLKSKTEKDKMGYKAHKNYVNLLIDKKKIAFFHDAFHENKGDQKCLYALVKRLTNNNRSVVYPEAPDDETLAKQFSDFFEEKIKKINNSFPAQSSTETAYSPQPTRCSYVAFPEISPDEVRRYIFSSPTKSCLLDPVPTFLLKNNLDIVLPTLTAIVNKSLTQGYIPPVLKQALITPIPKKPKITEFKNFRPISNLPFLSKVLERIVIDHLSSYCAENGLNEPFQSAYRKHHSCETALLQVFNIILSNTDNQNVTLLTLLDLSAAFDTVPHKQFLSKLEAEYGIKDTAHSWFESYFKDRYQTVQINSSSSAPKALNTGMPQGSGAGPWGYTRYTGSLGVLLRLLTLMYHIFADDTQVNTSLNPNHRKSQLDAKEKLENCLKCIASWMSDNRLKLNSDKTEFMILGTKAQTSKLEFNSINVCGEVIKANPRIRNLGIWMDPELKMHHQVQHIQQVCFRNIRELRSIRKFLDTVSMKTLVQAMVTSHLDYGNSLLYGINRQLLDKLQRVQNAAARLILGIPKHDHITTGLIKLHWLPVRQRIIFKIAVITFKVLNENEPVYLRELLVVNKSARSLRSSSNTTLLIPKSKLKCAGDRSFSVSAPTIWNSLPERVRSSSSLLVFKKQLKTYLFKQALDLNYYSCYHNS